MKEISKEDFMSIDSSMSCALSIVNGLTCAFGSLGNIVLIAIILLHKNLHGASEMLLMSLALADFVTCAFFIPLLLVRLNTSEKLPTTMNQSRRALGQATAVCVSLNLLMLTADRLIFFYRPLHYAHWMRKKVVIVIIIIIYGISLMVGMYAYYDMVRSQYLKVALVGIAMLIFFILHYAICRLAVEHRSKVANQEQSLQHNYHVTSSAIRQARRNGHTVMLFGILYLITWLPVTIFHLVRSVRKDHDPEIFQKYFYLLVTIQQISSSLDPFLCCYRNKKVNEVFKKLLHPQKSINEVAASRHSLGNTVSLSYSDGLDSSCSKNKEMGKPSLTVSESFEKMLDALKNSDENVVQSLNYVEFNRDKNANVSTPEKSILTDSRNSQVPQCVERDTEAVGSLKESYDEVPLSMDKTLDITTMALPKTTESPQCIETINDPSSEQSEGITTTGDQGLHKKVGSKS